MAKILCVDDEAFMRKVVKDTLSKNGYTDLYEAVDGADAVDKFTEISPDLVIMDITMPNMNGLEALMCIKKEDRNSKVIMITAAGQKEKMLQAIKEGADDFITKPFDADQILGAIERVM